MKCIEIKEKRKTIMKELLKISSEETIKNIINNKMYVNGEREGEFMSYHNNPNNSEQKKKCIGPIRFLWKEKENTILLWMHPMMFNEINAIIKVNFNVKNLSRFDFM
jgi:hypothetical protein